MATKTVVVVGGGFSGCGAAITAAKSGARVLLLERTDMLTGAGIRAGRTNFNGKLVAAEEAKALGGGDIFEALESIILHRCNIIEEEHGYVYDTARVEPTVRRMVEKVGVELHMESRAVDVEKKGDDFIAAVRLAGGERIEGDVFIDCSGSAGGVSICVKYGKGCAMCVPYRCLVFGDRVSIATRAGAPELMKIRPDGTPGAIGAAITIHKATLKRELRERLEKEGAICIPLPQELIDYSKQHRIGAPRSRRQMEYINLVDIGIAAKCVALGYLRLKDLRSVPGFEMAQIEDPLGGGSFNRISKVSMTPRDNSLRVKGFQNLFVAGEKGGPGIGLAEAVFTGAFAGANAARLAAGQEPLVLPRSLAIGDFVAYTGEMMATQEGLNQTYSTGAGVYFERLKQLGLYTTDVGLIRKRVSDLGLQGILAKTTL